MSEVGEKSAYFQLLSDSAAELASTEGLGPSVERLCRHLTTSIGIDGFLHFRGCADSAGDLLELEGHGGLNEEAAAGLRHVALEELQCGGDAPGGAPAATGHVSSTGGSGAPVARRLGATAYLCRPLASTPVVLGAVAFFRRGGADFTSEEVTLLETICDMIGLARSRERSDEAARDSEARYRALAELSPDAMLVNVDGQFVYANRAAAGLVGAPEPRDVVGRPSSEFMLPESHPIVSERTRRVVEEARAHRWMESRWRRLDGSIADVEAGVAPITWDGRPAVQVVARDISERKRAEKDLRESELKHRTLFDSIDVGFCIIEVLFDASEKPVDLRFLETNPAFREQTGLKDPVGRRVTEVAPALEEHWLETYGKVARTGEAVRFENRAAALGRWFDVYAFRFGDPEQHLVAVLFEDVTARKRAEEEREALERRLASDLEAMNRLHALSTRLVETTELPQMLEEILDATIALQGADFGHIQLYDAETGSLRFGVQRGFGEEFLEHFGAVQGADDSACARALKERRRVIVEDVAVDPGYAPHRSVTARAGYRAVQSTPMFGRGGEPRGMLSTHFRRPHRPSERDLRLTDLYMRLATELLDRERGEEELRDARRSLEIALDAARMGVWDIDLITGAARTSLRHDRIFGYSERVPSWGLEVALEHIVPDQRETFSAAFAEALETGEFEAEVRVRWLDGTLRWVHDRGRVYHDERGEPIRMAGVTRDVTEEKAAQAALREAKRVAEAGNEAKSRFLAVMSHELRTPLTGVIGCADLLDAEVLGPLNDEQRDAVERVKTNAWHLVGIIEEILTLSRTEAGKEEVHWEEADVAAIAREVVSIVEPQGGRPGLAIEAVDAEEPAVVSTDPGKVRQILLNLVGNAVKYAPEGAITVRVDRSSSDALEVDVRDTGPGIPADEQESVFEPFTQVDSSHTRAGSGTGLGLTICRRLARLLGGDVTLRSTLGEGSTFTLHLPRWPERGGSTL